MKITQNIVDDLLPVYLAGEASTDTRSLLEEYQREHPEFAQHVREAAARANALLDAPVEAVSPDREKAALEGARKRLRIRSQMLGFCIGYGLMPFAFVFQNGHVVWLMVRDNPKQAVAFWIVSAACAVGAWLVGRRTTAGA